MNGKSLLSICSAGDWEDAVAEVRADPIGARAKDGKGRTPLHLAAMNKASLEAVTALLEAYNEGAKAEDKDKMLPLHLALENNASPGVVSALLDAFREGAKIGDSRFKRLPIHYAAANNASLDVVSALLDAFKEGAKAEDRERRLPIHHAAANKASLDVVNALLAAFKEGAQAEDGCFNRLPLHDAAEGNASLEVVNALLDAFKDEGAQAEDTDKMLPLHRAAATKASPNVVSALLDAFKEGAQAEDGQKMLPLHYAAANNASLEVVNALLEAFKEGAQAKDSNKSLPLHSAAANNATLEVISALLEAYILAVQAEGYKNRLPLECSNNLEIQALIRDAEVEVLNKSLSDEAMASQLTLHKHERVHDLVTEFCVSTAAGNPSCLDYICADGNSLYDGAHPKVRKALWAATSLLGRYSLHLGKQVHVSATCTVVFAADQGIQEEDDAAEAVKITPSAENPSVVALKLMSSGEQFGREVRTRCEKKLQEQHIVNVLRIHVPAEDLQWAEEMCKGTEVEVFSYAASSVKAWAVLKRPSSIAAGSSAVNYKYVVVMPVADRNLSAAITHERLGAGEDWDLVMRISRDLGNALRHLHMKNHIHGDLKPLNAVRTGETWRLIDLGTSCKINDSFGSKKPSSGSCPPEMAKYLLRCNEASSDQAVAAILAKYKAHESYDLWSFGTVLFHLGSGSSLWHCEEHSGNIASIDDMKMLAEWDKKKRQNKMSRLRGDEPKQQALYDLVQKLLEPCPEARIKHFPQAMTSVLEHPFLKGTTLDPETSNAYSKQTAEKQAGDGSSWLRNIMRFAAGWGC